MFTDDDRVCWWLEGCEQCDGVLKVRVDSEVTTLRLWPLMTLLSRTADQLYRLDCDGILMSDSDSSGRVSCLLHTYIVHCAHFTAEPSGRL